MTEDEAKTKWCPFVRLTDGGQMYFDNRGRQFGGTSGKDGVDASLCIGSGCMAWRWIGPEIETVEFRRMAAKPEGEGWYCMLPDAGREKYEIKSQWERRDPNRQGFCGLAGKS